MRRRASTGYTLLAFVLLLAGTMPLAPALGQGAPEGLGDGVNPYTDGTYIVLMNGDPVVAYEGGIAGLPATAPAEGKKADRLAKKVVDYQAHLVGQHNGALDNVGVGQAKKLYDYTFSLNGFAVELTAAEAFAMSKMADVYAVVPDEKRQIETVSTPDYLGLTAEGGAWDQGYQGENVVIGVIDTGIWPENPSFSDRTGTNPVGVPGKLGFRQIPGWNGRCVPGEQFNASDCNNKLIGARYYAAGFGGEAGLKASIPYEIYSARDVDGHGSHTSSTAGGNAVAAVVGGLDLGTLSGMAPRARIAMYKACWGIGGDPAAGCTTVDTTAAIDQAVADGVDVINYSISGTRTNFLDPVEVSFLFASRAGVFVAVSAGNSGPAVSTVAHPSPWVTTVAAGTHDRFFEGSVILGDGSEYVGASLQNTGTDELEIVYAGDHPAAGVTADRAALCDVDTLDSAAVSGKMVVCDRGEFARVTKSATVAAAGGVAMIHANVDGGSASINADLHAVPTVHVVAEDGNAIKDYIAANGGVGTASLTPGVQLSVGGGDVADFSSRGPLLASTDLLKPDIMAPGVDILAAVSPIGYGGENYSFLSGTSMSSPHIAGLAALVKSAHPKWSPAMIKSALMTTANDSDQSPFDEGSGEVRPNSALNPGLVYDTSYVEYLGFLCGTGQLDPGFCDANVIDILDPSDLNQPNITIGELAGSQTVTRTVTNVGGGTHTYTASVDAPAGVDVVVEPASMTLAPRQSATFTVTFTVVDDSVAGDYGHGTMTWSHGPHNVNSTLTVRPLQIAAPAEVSGDGTDGSLDFDVTFGYSGDYIAGAHGLEAPLTFADTVNDDPNNDFGTALGTCDFSAFPFVCEGIDWFAVPVAADSALARFSLFDDYTDGADDLDLYVYDSGFGFVAGSGSGTSAEQVQVLFPEHPVYFVAVHAWQSDGADTAYTLFNWAVPAAAGSSNMTVTAPAAAVLGATETITVDWAGLDAGTKYLGAVSHADADGIFEMTVVGIDTD